MTKAIPTHRRPLKDCNNDNRTAGTLSISRSRSLSLLMAMLLMLVSALTETKQVSAFARVVIRSSPPKVEARVLPLRGQLCTTPENDIVYSELYEEIEAIARELWGGDEIPRLTTPTASTTTNNNNNNKTTTCTTPEEGGQQQQGMSVLFEGEAELPGDIPFSERGDYFRREALRGCPKAQHSYALLLWSGFAGIEQDPEESAKFHAAAACQHHLDGIAVLGGCLRTGTGIPKPKKVKKSKTKPAPPKRNTVALGLKAIVFCASQEVGNPTGVNKEGALLEYNGDDLRAFELYEACWKSGRANALLLFNLGWCLVHSKRKGIDCDSDRARGISFWKEATEMAPDEGSEEAAWNLFKEYIRDDPKEAQHWLDLAEDLGYYE